MKQLSGNFYLINQWVLILLMSVFCGGSDSPTILETKKFHRGYQSAIEFNGVDQRLEAPKSAALNFRSGDFTVCAWVNQSSSSGRQDVVSKQSSTLALFGSYGLRIENSFPIFTVRSSCCRPWYDHIKSSVPIEINSWHMLPGVGDSKKGEIRFYVDGRLIDARSWNGELYHTEIQKVLVGAHYKADSRGKYLGHFNGMLDDISIWKVAISEDEIIGLYQQPNALLRNNDLLAKWDFNSSNSPELIDVSGNGHHAIGINNPLRVTR